MENRPGPRQPPLGMRYPDWRMYWRRAIGRTKSDLRQFWSAHRIWTTISGVVAIIVLGLSSNGLRLPTDRFEAIRSLLLGITISPVGTLVISLFFGVPA